ncbi:MAG: hypothetical protein DRN68_07060 [Thaumarchaeota archaeon]|nr:MAG: hypothetical protein DRN68_07060 [Nitrososphaerota archaeon]
MAGFVLAPKKQFEVQVTGTDDAGKEATITFFVRRPRAKDASVFPMTEGETRDPIEVLSAFVVGWRGVTDENGDEIPFNKDNLGLLPLDILNRLLEKIAELFRLPIRVD